MKEIDWCVGKSDTDKLRRACLCIDELTPWVSKLIADNPYLTGHARRVLHRACAFVATIRGRTADAVAVAQFLETECDGLRKAAEEAGQQNESLRNRLMIVEEIANDLLACRKATGENDNKLYKKLEKWVSERGN